MKTKKIAVLSILFSIIALSAFSVTPIREKKTTKPIVMDKAMFIEKVFDYENNTTEWKYNGDKPAVIDYWASWCGPCRRLSPILDEIAAEYSDEIYVYKINVDEQKELATTFGIQSIPAILFIPMKGTPRFASGVIPQESFRQVIEEFLLNKK